MNSRNAAKPLFVLWGIPSFIIASYGLLMLQGDVRFSIPILIGVTASTVIGLSIVCSFGEKYQILWSPAVILSVAIIVRSFFLLQEPRLSDDIYRYLWDGLQTLSGKNPYAYAPLGAPPLDTTPRDLLQMINHPELVTIYPPAGQCIFLIGCIVTKSVIGFKAMLCIFDIITCIVIIKILNKMKKPIWKTVLYAWHPLPVIEIAGSGHIDGAGILFLLVSIYFLQSATLENAYSSARGKEWFPLFAGIAFSAATLIKLYPLILFPIFVLFLRGFRRFVFICGFVVGIVAFTLPFMPEVKNIFETLGIYLKNWEFSNFLFRTVRDLTSSGIIARLFVIFSFVVIAFCFTLRFWIRARNSDGHVTSPKIAVGEQHKVHFISNTPFNYFLHGIYLITFSYLLLTPTLYPWYVLSLVCLFPFIAGVGGLIFSWSVFLSYYIIIDYAYLGQWTERNDIPALIWCAPALGFLIGKIISQKSSGKSSVSLP